MEILKEARSGLVPGASKVGAVQLRDIRTLDNTFSHSQEPVILVRTMAIIMNLHPVRALLLKDKVMVFVPGKFKCSRVMG